MQLLRRGRACKEGIGSRSHPLKERVHNNDRNWSYLIIWIICNCQTAFLQSLPNIHFLARRSTRLNFVGSAQGRWNIKYKRNQELLAYEAKEIMYLAVGFQDVQVRKFWLLSRGSNELMGSSAYLHTHNIWTLRSSSHPYALVPLSEH